MTKRPEKKRNMQCKARPQCWFECSPQFQQAWLCLLTPLSFCTVFAFVQMRSVVWYSQPSALFILISWSTMPSPSCSTFRRSSIAGGFSIWKLLPSNIFQRSALFSPMLFPNFVSQSPYSPVDSHPQGWNLLVKPVSSSSRSCLNRLTWQNTKLIFTVVSFSFAGEIWRLVPCLRWLCDIPAV